jgi:hypothetical protein
MASLTLSDYDDILKEFYLPLFEKQFVHQTVLMDDVILKRDSEHIEGKYAYIPLEFETWGGFGSVGESDTLPTPEPSDYARTRVPMAYHYAAFRLTGPVMEASRSQSGAFAPSLNREMTSKINVFHRQINRQLWNDGSGVLALVDDGSPDVTLGVDAAYGIANDDNGALFIGPNMNLNFQSAKSGGTDRGNARVTAVSGSTITIDADPGVSDNDFIFLEGGAGNEMMGLYGGIDNYSIVSTFQNLTSATQPSWISQIHNGASAGTAEPLTRTRINKVLRDVNHTGGGDTKFILGSPDVQLAYGDMAARNNIQVNEIDLDNGWRGLSYNGIPWMADKFAPENKAAFIDPSALRIYEMARPQWLDRGTGVLKQVGRTDVYEAQYFWYAELGFGSRRKLAWLNDISVL